jgi:hypothetical protein
MASHPENDGSGPAGEGGRYSRALRGGLGGPLHPGSSSDTTGVASISACKLCLLESHAIVQPWAAACVRLSPHPQGAFAKLDASLGGLAVLVPAVWALGPRELPDVHEDAVDVALHGGTERLRHVDVKGSVLLEKCGLQVGQRLCQGAPLCRVERNPGPARGQRSCTLHVSKASGCAGKKNR